MTERERARGGMAGEDTSREKEGKVASHVAGKRPTPWKGIGEIAVYLWRRKRERERERESDE